MRLRRRRSRVLWAVAGPTAILLALLVARSSAVRYRILGPLLAEYVIPSYVGDCTSPDALQRAQALRMIVVLRRGLTAKSVERAQDLLLESLDDPSPEVRLAAAEAAGDFELTRAAPRLRRLLQNPQESSSVRSAAAMALGELGAPAAVDSLLVALQSDDEGLRQAAQWALVRTGSAAAAPMAALLRSSDTAAQQRAARALAQLGAPAVPPLIAELHNADEDRAALASATLAQMGGPAISALAQTLARAPSPRTRQLAAATLDHIIEQQPPGALRDTYGTRCRAPLQRAATHDPIPLVRRTAVSALVVIGQLCHDTQAILDCMTALEDPDLDVRQESEHGLRSMGRLAAEVLQSELARLDGGKKPPTDSDDVAQLISEYRDRRAQ